ncbi:hypothetical protein FQZ97_690130 [compost metagenome]
MLVAQRQQQLFAVGEGVDGVDQRLAEVAGQEGVQRVAVGRAVAQGGRPVGLARDGVGFGREIFVVDDLHALGVMQQGLVFAQRDVELLRDLGFGGGAHQALLQVLDGLLDLACLGPDAARQPVLAAQLVQHRATDTGRGVRLELGVGGFLVTADGIEQADHAGLYQVVEFYAGR